MPPLTTTGDISYRTAGYMAKELLKRAQPLLIVSQLGQPKPLPKNATRTMKFRGYEHLPNQPKPLTEGVTPRASKPTFRDVEVTIGQYGDYVHLTDVLADTHEDPLIAEFSDILGEQAAIMMERVVIGGLLAGTNVHFSGSTGGVIATSRAGVNEPLTLQLQRRIMRGLKRQLAQPITNLISASPNFSTFPIAPSYIAVCHTDCEADILMAWACFCAESLTVENWAYDRMTNPKFYMVYPAVPQCGDVWVEATFGIAPCEITSPDQEIGLPDDYAPALQHHILAAILSGDNDTSNHQKAVYHIQMYSSLLGIKKMVDVGWPKAKSTVVLGGAA